MNGKKRARQSDKDFIRFGLFFVTHTNKKGGFLKRWIKNAFSFNRLCVKSKYVRYGTLKIRHRHIAPNLYENVILAKHAISISQDGTNKFKRG